MCKILKYYRWHNSRQEWRLQRLCVVHHRRHASLRSRPMILDPVTSRAVTCHLLPLSLCACADLFFRFSRGHVTGPEVLGWRCSARCFRLTVHLKHTLDWAFPQIGQISTIANQIKITACDRCLSRKLNIVLRSKFAVFWRLFHKRELIATNSTHHNYVTKVICVCQIAKFERDRYRAAPG